MSTAGRIPMPAQVKLAKGKPGARALVASLPETDETLPEPPLHFNALQRVKFLDVRGKIERMRLATASDREMLETLAIRLAEIEELNKDIQKNGRTYETTNINGGKIRRARPEVRMLGDALRHTQVLLHEFGLSPAARSKVAARGKKKEEGWDDV